MKLPALSFFKKQTPKEYFLALLLEEESIRAVVFEEMQGAMHTVGEGKQELPAPLDDTSFEELLQSSDKAISQAESSLPDGIQSHKTIFGVKQNWTENLQIGKEHLLTLKKLCDELDLAPIGFLVFAEAIAHLLQKEEGAPVSGILVELGEKHITATLLRAGRVIASQQIPNEEPLVKTVDALLGKFDVEILPSRIIILDSQKREHLIQQFTNHTWSKHLPFLHVPQVTPLPDGFETKAILFGTATQMGFDMLDLPRLKTKKIVPDDTQVEEELEKEQDKPEEMPEQPREETLEEPEIKPEAEKTSGADNFGFVKDTDVLENEPMHPHAFSSNVADANIEDLADATFGEIPESVKEREEKSQLPGLGANAVMISEGMKNVFGRLRKIPFASVVTNIQSLFPQNGTSPRLGLLIIPVILILGIAGILWYIFGLKATATLLINPKQVQASQSVTFSATDGTNADSQIIGGTVVPIQEDGKVSTDATGKKDVGDKAKGTVTIYNNDDSTHTLTAGTTLTSANGLKFVTNKDVTIASASGDIFSGTKPGTASVDITAANIGTEYNLPSGTKFAIGSSTVIAAKNDAALSGGTKKSVTVVAQADLDKLTQDLTNSLSDKAKQDITKSTNGKAVLPGFLSADMSNKQFSNTVGDEASNVNLSATINYQVLTYTTDDLNTIALAILQKSNQGANISPENLSLDIQNPTVAKDGKSVSAKLAIKAGLLPKVDTSQIAQRLAGKSFDQATTILSDIPDLASVKGVLSPNLFFLPHIFPRIASHITVGVAANE